MYPFAFLSCTMRRGQRVRRSTGSADRFAVCNEHTSILLFPALLQLNSMAIFEQNAVQDQFFTPN